MCALLNVNRGMCWVNRSVHGCKGHGVCIYNSARACVCVLASSKDMESETSNNQKGKYAKGCLQAKNNNVVCFCSDIISVVMSAALKG